jgi:ubiquinone/menaquinone biosynthesis C-methylase UbiE
MPFGTSSFDAINVSSILHEISTYGYTSENDKIYGIEAITAAVSEMKRVLKEDGILFYRDILAPEEQTFYQKEYSDSAVCYFLDLFLKNFT